MANKSFSAGRIPSDQEYYITQKLSVNPLWVFKFSEKYRNHPDVIQYSIKEIEKTEKIIESILKKVTNMFVTWQDVIYNKPINKLQTDIRYFYGALKSGTFIKYKESANAEKRRRKDLNVPSEVRQMCSFQFNEMPIILTELQRTKSMCRLFIRQHAKNIGCPYDVVLKTQNFNQLNCSGDNLDKLRNDIITACSSNLSTLKQVKTNLLSIK